LFWISTALLEDLQCDVLAIALHHVDAILVCHVGIAGQQQQRFAKIALSKVVVPKI
jgi:hypothetical protein